MMMIFTQLSAVVSIFLFYVSEVCTALLPHALCSAALCCVIIH